MASNDPPLVETGVVVEFVEATTGAGALQPGQTVWY
jgi:hypothetical protein